MGSKEVLFTSRKPFQRPLFLLIAARSAVHAAHLMSGPLNFPGSHDLSKLDEMGQIEKARSHHLPSWSANTDHCFCEEFYRKGRWLAAGLEDGCCSPDTNATVLFTIGDDQPGRIARIVDLNQV